MTEYNVTGTVSLEELEARAQEEAAGAQEAAPSSVQEEEAVVTAVRMGKAGSQTCICKPGSSVGDLMVSLGWDTNGVSYKLKTDGETGVSNFTNASFTFKPGSHTLFVSPRVTGG
jgi:hypothetical protein